MKRPNIFLLVMDTARASSFSVYGAEEETDPNISEIADEGVKFESCYSNCIWTLPSHYSMFTGKLPSHHGVISKDERASDLDFLPELLSEKGYTTAAVSSNAWVSSFGGFEGMFEQFHFLGDSFSIEDKMLIEEDKLFKEVYELEEDGKWQSKKQKYFYLLKESVRRFSPQSIFNGAYYLLNERIFQGKEWEDGAKEANRLLKKEFRKSEEPFFGFVNYVEAHDPYTPPREIAEQFLDEYSYAEAMEIAKNTNLVDNMREDNSDRSKVLENLYNAEIKYLDKKISKLIEDIESETDRETIFIITSDHGENFDEGENLWGHYGKITENLIHVPLVIKGIGQKEIKNNFSLRDLKPLVLSFSNGEEEIRASEKVITEYWGLKSHNWEISEEGLKSEFFQNQKSLMGDDFSVWGETFEVGDLGQEKKDYISIRCGGP